MDTIAPPDRLLPLLKRCSDLERMAAAVYEVLAHRFAADTELAALWASLARDEHEHARKLDALAEPMAPVPPGPGLDGLDEQVADVHWLLAESHTAAATADEEEAFAIALAIESSELDAISAAVMQAAATGERRNLAEAMRHDTAGHHEKLLTLVRRRCRAERTLRRAALLAGHHPH
jgi:rubrerythrin